MLSPMRNSRSSLILSFSVCSGYCNCFGSKSYSFDEIVSVDESGKVQIDLA